MNSKLLIGAALCTAALSACQSIDNAGLVYGSRTIGGIDVSGGPQGGTGGANISFGYKREDLAFIPVAVCEEGGEKTCKKIEKLIGSQSGTGQNGVSEETAQKIIDDPKASAKEKVKRLLEVASKDSYSVFGSFEGRGIGGASSAEASVGNLFAAGIAAQRLSESVGAAIANRSYAYCLSEVRRAKGVPADKPLSDEEILLCAKP